MAVSKKSKTVWFGMKLTPEQKGKIKKLADKKGVSQKKAVLELIEKELQKESPVPSPGSFLEQNNDLWGAGRSGLHDLSVNPKHFEGFGR